MMPASVNVSKSVAEWSFGVVWMVRLSVDFWIIFFFFFFFFFFFCQVCGALGVRDQQSLACCSKKLANHVRVYRNQLERLKAISQFRSAETKYVRLLRHSLNTGLSLFFSCLSLSSRKFDCPVSAGPLRELTNGASDELFVSIPTIKRVSLKVLLEISDRVALWDSETSVLGDIFAALGPALKLYHHFTSQYAKLNGL
jgi:hypothetical protein